MKKIFIFILLLSVTVQSLHKAVIVTGYYANTDAYAKNCENKLRPELHCNGKCQMIKKIKEEAKNEAEEFSKKGQSVEWISPSPAIVFAFSAASAASSFNLFVCDPLANISSSLFHPPGASAV